MSLVPRALTRRRFHIQMMMKTGSCLGGIALLTVADSATAQGADSTTSPSRTLAVWTAVAKDQPLNTRAGQTRDRDLYLFGGRARAGC